MMTRNTIKAACLLFGITGFASLSHSSPQIKIGTAKGDCGVVLSHKSANGLEFSFQSPRTASSASRFVTCNGSVTLTIPQGYRFNDQVASTAQFNFKNGSDQGIFLHTLSLLPGYNADNFITTSQGGAVDVYNLLEGSDLSSCPGEAQYILQVTGKVLLQGGDGGAIGASTKASLKKVWVDMDMGALEACK